MSVREQVANARIRAELITTRGALQCQIGNCQVITQGGPAGLEKHQRQIHFTDAWLRGEEDS